MDTNANVKQLSTVSNPLVLTYKGGYYVNKPGDQTGEYVSKEVAQDLLVELKHSRYEIAEVLRRIDNAIQKATQP